MPVVGKPRIKAKKDNDVRAINEKRVAAALDATRATKKRKGQGGSTHLHAKQKVLTRGCVAAPGAVA